MTWPRQAFVIGSDLLDSVSLEEVEATFADMREAGLARPPYDRFDVVLPPHRVFKVVDRETGEIVERALDPAATLRARFTGFIEPSSPAHFQWLFTRKGVTVDLVEWIHGHSPEPFQFEQFAIAAAATYQLLIVLLATKNISKETKECKLLKLGIGSKERNRYTTTLKIGKVTESTNGAGGGSGAPRRPHLRRGHVRRQHWGPHNELVKQIFIEPIFVNADKGWLAERTAYNLS